MFYKEATCKNSSKKGLLYPPHPEECKKGTLRDQLRLSRITATVLLSHWGRQLLEDMMSLGTDFEMHTILQGYVEEPTANDFVARKTHTIALRTRNPPGHDQVQITLGNCPEAVIGQVTINLIHEFGNPLRIRSPAVSLLPCFLERLALRNPRVWCQKHGGKCTTY
jgi:hypothetical protein